MFVPSYAAISWITSFICFVSVARSWVSVSNRVVVRQHSDSRRSSPLYFSEHQEEEEDWRDVRAKLMQQYNTDSEKKVQFQSTTNHTSTTNTTTATWAYDSGTIVECGSLIVSHPIQDFACGGLKQQYFHKCVVLVVKHDAHFTKGVLLNRLTKPIQDKQGNTWTMNFGGDVQGWNSPHPDYTCLHRLKNPKSLEWSLPVVKDIQVSMNNGIILISWN